MSVRALFLEVIMSTAELAKLTDRMDKVLRYLDNHRGKAAEALFATSDQAYRDAWKTMGPLQFWYRLDMANAKTVVKMALEYYGDA